MNFESIVYTLERELAGLFLDKLNTEVTNVHRLTWQPHGSQFTIMTNVSDNRLKIRIRRPPLLDRDEVLTQLKFDPSWIEIVK